MSESDQAFVIPDASPEVDSRPGRFLPYPVSTLSAAIQPTDLTCFRSRGAATVERSFRQELAELRTRYVALIDRFNWNKLAYEARYSFEPLVGETYHLYGQEDGFTLSLIEPERWPGRRWIASLTLGVGGQWMPVSVSEDFDLSSLALRGGDAG